MQRRRAVVRRLGDAAAPPPRAGRRRGRAHPGARGAPRACATPTVTCTPTAPRCSASRRSTTPTAARPPTRSCASPPTSRARPRSSSRAPTSCPTRAGARRRGVLLARVGPPRHALGRHPARRRRRRARARWWPAATSGSRSASRRGRPTARSGSSATARGSGASTAGRPIGGREVVVDLGKDIGYPQWVFGQSSYAFLADGRVVFAYSRRRPRAPRGAGAGLRSGDARSTCRSPSIDALRARGDRAVCIAAGADHRAARRRDRRRRRRPSTCSCRHAISAWTTRGSPSPSPSRSPPAGGDTAHALLYRPTNPDVDAPDGERPPLLVMIHGGPTAAARPMLQLSRHYWTSRGFAVVDVNYRGSTGYGRAYRDLLRGRVGRRRRGGLRRGVRLPRRARRRRP